MTMLPAGPHVRSVYGSKGEQGSVIDAADPGTLGGALVARQLDVPVVFSLAPDPHGPISAAEAAGTLDRVTFADADARGALWYRADLVERLARDNGLTDPSRLEVGTRLLLPAGASTPRVAAGDAGLAVAGLGLASAAGATSGAAGAAAGIPVSAGAGASGRRLGGADESVRSIS